MTKRPEPIDRELRALKSTIDHHLVSDYDSDKLRMKIREAISAADSSSSGGFETTGDSLQPGVAPKVEIHVRRRATSGWRRRGPFAAGAVAVCVVLAGALLYSGKLQRGAVPSGGSPTVTEVAGLFSTGFQPIATPDAMQFQHVNSITVFLGNNWGFQTPESVDGGTVQLTAGQQQMFYHIMQASQRKSVSSTVVQTTSLPLHIWFGASNDNEQFMYEGYYSTSGAMVLGSSQVYAPNPDLTQFMTQYVISQLLQKYRNAGKVLPNSLPQAALGFVHNLGDASTAYKYCVPDMVFSRNTSIRQLQSQASSRGFADFQIQSITYGPGNADAIVVLKNPNRFLAQAITLNLVHIGDAWLVIQASMGTAGRSASGSTTSGTQGTEAQPTVVPGSPYDGVTPVAPFGQSHTLIIGPSVGMVTPTGNTPYGKKGQYTAITYNDLNSPAYQSAQIIVYERIPLTNNSTILDASRALKTNPAFQKAVAAAKVHHAVLVVTGGADKLLTRDMMVQTLGVQSTTGDDTQPATTITVWFEGPNKALFSGITAEENGGLRITYLDPMILDQSISQAALIRDTWGAVMS
jgi:hypothetical protein